MEMLIRDKIEKIIVSSVDNELKNKGADSLLQGNYIDSLSFVSIIVDLEEEFDIEFPPEYMLIEKFSSVTTILELLEQIKLEVI